MEAEHQLCIASPLLQQIFHMQGWREVVCWTCHPRQSTVRNSVAFLTIIAFRRDRGGAETPLKCSFHNEAGAQRKT